VTAEEATNQAQERADMDRKPYGVFILLHSQKHYVKPLDEVSFNEEGLATKFVRPKEGEN
jgi:hypothetical protein